MLINIKFLGVLSAKYGTSPIIVDIVPDYESLNHKIRELLGDHCTTNYVILRKGKPLNKDNASFNGKDEFCVLLPISGG